MTTDQDQAPLAHLSNSQYCFSFSQYTPYLAFQYPNYLASLRAFKHTIPPPSTPPRKDRLAHPWPLQIVPSRWLSISLPTLALPWLLTLVPSITIHNEICWLPLFIYCSFGLVSSTRAEATHVLSLVYILGTKQESSIQTMWQVNIRVHKGTEISRASSWHMFIVPRARGILDP